MPYWSRSLVLSLSSMIRNIYYNKLWTVRLQSSNRYKIIIGMPCGPWSMFFVRQSSFACLTNSCLLLNQMQAPKTSPNNRPCVIKGKLFVEQLWHFSCALQTSQCIHELINALIPTGQPHRSVWEHSRHSICNLSFAGFLCGSLVWITGQ